METGLAANLQPSHAKLQKLATKSEPQTARCDREVALVGRMPEIRKRTGGLGPPIARKLAGAQRARLPTIAGGDAGATELGREIAATDREIDDLVYELYGITDEERKIIEGAL
jgi:hypothetical protein